jgi:hypothetical protein
MSIEPCTTVVGVFNERCEAERAIDDLRKADFSKDRIAVINCGPQGKPVINKKGETETHTVNGTIMGAVAGIGIGTLVGLAVLAGVLPVIGRALVAGTVGMVLTNAAAGAVIAVLSGAMIGRCFFTERAKYFGSRILVTVRKVESRISPLCCRGSYIRQRSMVFFEHSREAFSRPFRSRVIISRGTRNRKGVRPLARLTRVFNRTSARIPR